MKTDLQKIVNSSTIVSAIAIIAMAICCLAALGYNSKVTIEKEKIEASTNSTFNLIR